jgi:hypothetical protein
MAGGDVVTHVGFGENNVPVSSLLTIRDRQAAPTGALNFTGRHLICGIGGPLTNRAGVVVGVVTSESTALPIQRAVPLVELARENVAVGRMHTTRQIAELENHLYGSVLFLSETPSLNARVRPLETWHWLSEQVFTTPFSFTGPMGRYEVEVLLEGRVANTYGVEVRPTITIEFNLYPGSVAASGGGSALPAILMVTGLAAGGATIAGITLQGGGNGDPPPPPITTGSITITWQDPNR